MRIVVNHLTRMQPGYICVAGIDLDTGRHVRPVLNHGRLDTALLLRNGGPFDIETIVELGRTTYCGQAPEVEDHRFNSHAAKRVGDTTPEDFWTQLERTPQNTLEEIFGPELEHHDWSYTTARGTGRASLGCLRVRAKPRLYVTDYGKVRLSGRAASLSVTDLRLYEGFQYTPRRDVVAQVARRIGRGEGLILSLGLGRPFRKSEDSLEQHWLQVNNIHLEEDPVWSDSAS